MQLAGGDDEERAQGIIIRFDLDGALRADFKTRQEGLKIQREMGVINANEWRRLEDMNEIGAEGDKYIVERNMTTLEKVGEDPAPAAAPAAAANEPEADDVPDEGEVAPIDDRVIDAAQWRRQNKRMSA